MKAHFHRVPRSIEQNYLARQHTLPNFGTIWHYHPELELHYIIRGEGVRFVGDNISNFYPTELLLLGENLPHMWRCSEKYFAGDPHVTAEAIVVHFMPEFMGNDLLKMTEAGLLTNLFERAKNGLMIEGKTKKQVFRLMQQSVAEQGLKRAFKILEMLIVLADSRELVPITTSQRTYRYNHEETTRLNEVYQYMLNNYSRDLPLDEIAAVANLSVTSFCRYFKMMTKKTFHDFLIELRISHARQLLMSDSPRSVENICFECGFNNRSNFFTHFKRITGYTPLEFKKKYSSVASFDW